MPNERDAYYGELDQRKWSLIPVAQLDSYKGLIFATFDPAAPSLLDYLGEMTWYLDCFFDRREGGIEVVVGVQKWTIPSNWKLPAENFAGDSYHVSWSHLSAIKTGFAGDFRVSPAPRERSSRRATATASSPSAPKTCPFPPEPAILEYEAQVRAEVTQRLGKRFTRVNPIAGLCFPTCPCSRCFFHLSSLAPQGADKTEVWSWIFADKAAPDHRKDQFRLASIRGFGPSGTFEQDDMDNWQECTQTWPGSGVPKVTI